MRLLVHTDQRYLADGEGVSTSRNFVAFVAELAEHADGVTVMGRLAAEPGRAQHALPAGLGFCALPDHGSSARPWRVAATAWASCRALRRALGRADAVWLLGPNLLTLPFAAIARLAGKRVALGVRQDIVAYVAARHRGRPWAIRGARLLDAGFRRLARRLPLVVVGPELARRYAGSPVLHETCVSLVRGGDVVSERWASSRVWDGELRLLAVTRLDAEKNPLLLADALALLDDRWRLTVCGDGPLAGALRDRCAALGVAGRIDLLGDVGAEELRRRYLHAHAFLHVSWTEGLPQVLFEAFAAGIPVVATAVGGVPAAAGDAALLVAPGDASAVARALGSLSADPALRRRLVAAGLHEVRGRTLEAQAAQTAAFLLEPAARSAT